MLPRHIKQCTIVSASSFALSLICYLTWTANDGDHRPLVLRQPQLPPVTATSPAQASFDDENFNQSSDLQQDPGVVAWTNEDPNSDAYYKNFELDYPLSLSAGTRPYDDPSIPCVHMPDIDNATQLELLRSCQGIFYNRAPKCGSRAVLSTFKKLGVNLGYSVFAAEKPGRRSFFPDNNMLVPFTRNFTKLPSPFIYAQHLYFVDFEKYGLRSPVYINVIREPVEGLISHYFFKVYGSSNAPLTSPRPRYNMSLGECVARRLGSCMNIHQIIPFFCGHSKECREIGQWNLQQAIYNLEEHYLVVGLTEDIPAFMEVIEFLLPKFFASASDVFLNLEAEFKDRYKTSKKHAVPSVTKAILRAHLRYEYDFYYHARRRFYTLLSKVRHMKRQIQAARDVDNLIDNLAEKSVISR